MGIQNGKQVLFKMTDVVSRELRSLLKDTVFKLDSTKSGITQYRMDCDISNILHLKSFKHHQSFTLALVRDVAQFLKDLAADTGFVVTAVLDGDVRPQSKRDAFKRRFDSSMDRINAFYCRQSAMKIASLNQKTKEEEELLEKYNKMAKKLDSTTRLVVPTNLKELLNNALHEIGGYNCDSVSGGYVNVNIIQAEFEADYIISYRFRHNLSDCVYSADGDMSALCGPTCISIRSFKNKKKKDVNNNETTNEKPIKFYELTGTSNTVMKNFQKQLQPRMSSSSQTTTTSLQTSSSNQTDITFEEAKYPIFEESNLPPYLIALYAVGLGCDVIPGGIPGITPLVIHTSIQKMYEGPNKIQRDEFGKRYRKLVDIYLDKCKKAKSKITEKCIRTYMQAWMYQPALEFGKATDKDAYKYVFHEPITLSPYLRMFAHPNGQTKIDVQHDKESNDSVRSDEDNEDECEKNNEKCLVIQCPGFNQINLPHSFLKSEGEFTCKKCGVVFCKTCGYSPSKDRVVKKKTKNTLEKIHYKNMDDDLCMECYQQCIFLPYSDNLEEVLSLEEMKSYLKNNNQSFSGDASPHEIQEMYELVFFKKNTNVCDENVPFPLCPSSSLHLDEENNFAFGKMVCEFDMKSGGAFINLPDITNEMVPGLVGLVTSLIEYKTEEDSENNNDNEKSPT